jgi:hypothetical protein
MKAYWGSGGIAPRILVLGTRWKWVVSFMPRPLYHQGKSSWYPLDRHWTEAVCLTYRSLYPQRQGPRHPLDRRQGGSQSRSGGCGEEKKMPVGLLVGWLIDYVGLFSIWRSRVSSVVQRWAMGWYHGCSNPGKGWEYFSSLPRPDRLSGPPSLLSNEYQGQFPVSKAAGVWSWPLTSI